MKRSVARQEAIASKYTNGTLQNYSISETKKDERLIHRNVQNMQKKDARQSNAVQEESFKYNHDQSTLQRDLME